MTEPLLTVVIETVARYYSETTASILGPGRHMSTVVARHTAMYVARLAGDFSFTQIGDAFKRDHTSVMNACNKMAARTTRDPAYSRAVDSLVQEVQGLGLVGAPIKIRSELWALLFAKAKKGIYGRTVEDIVDRILCEHFQRELGDKS